MQNRRFKFNTDLTPLSPSPSLSPLRIRGLERELRDVDENFGQFHSFRVLDQIRPVRQESDRIRPFDSSSTRGQQRYTDVSMDGNHRFSSLNFVNEPVRIEPNRSRVIESGSVLRERHLQNLPPSPRRRERNVTMDGHHRYGFVSNLVTEPVQPEPSQVRVTGSNSFQGERYECLSRNYYTNAYEKIGNACHGGFVVPKFMDIDYDSSRIQASCRNVVARSRDYGAVDARNLSSSQKLDVLGESLELEGPSDHRIRASVKESKKLDGNAFFGGRDSDRFNRLQELICSSRNDDHVKRGVSGAKSHEYDRDDNVLYRGNEVKLSRKYGGLHGSDTSSREGSDPAELWEGDRVEMSGKEEYFMELEWSRHYNDKYDDVDENSDIMYEEGEWIEEIEERRAARRRQVGENEEELYRGSSVGVFDSDDKFSLVYVPVCVQKYLEDPVEPRKGDVKKRLGPVSNVKQRLGPLKASTRLGVLPKIGKTLSWAKISGEKTLEGLDRNRIAQTGKFMKAKKNIKKHSKTEPPEEDYVDKKKRRKKKKKHVYAEAPKDYIDEETRNCVKTEPPEDSVEFVQLVQCAFLKYVKLLNKNPAMRRKYMEQDGTSVLKCSICGSSKGFSDTRSLAQHCFTSCRIGIRSEHLGFHKALCALMGWSPWFQKILPEAEALALEDLIIWPPLVLVHNSSIANDNALNYKTISNEELRNILKGKGLDQGIIRVSHGEAADHSIMVVCFSGTFSGLRHAEMLHGHYIEIKHGRTEFQQIGTGSGSSIGEKMQLAVADNTDSILYGYLGTAFDFDKLDSETKKRCVIKSRKEIKVIADAQPT